MNKIRNAAVAATIAMTIALSGCNVFRGQSTTGQYVDDVAITTKVKAELLDSKKVDGLEVNVDSKNGYVTLTGYASSAEERTRAGQLARDVKGVKGVDNDLQIKQ
jgi:hyperosmotically inducible periplasmic protein